MRFKAESKRLVPFLFRAHYIFYHNLWSKVSPTQGGYVAVWSETANQVPLANLHQSKLELGMIIVLKRTLKSVEFQAPIT